MRKFTITLDENEYDLVRFFIESNEDDYTEEDDDFTVGDEPASEVYQRVQEKFELL
jgi:hypothetical protein